MCPIHFQLFPIFIGQPNAYPERKPEQNDDWLTPWHQNPKVHHRIHNSPPTVPILGQVNPLHTPTTNPPKVHFDPILLSTPWSFKWSFSFGLSHQNPVHVSPLSHAYHIPRPPHSSWFDVPNIILWRAQIMKLPIVHLSPFSLCLIPLRSKCSPQLPVLR
jgi:hypothetical protein